MLSLLAVLASTLSSLLAANTLTISLYFGHTFTDVALLTGYHLLGVAVAGFLFVPSARVWGKRHAYLIGAILIIASSVWAGQMKNCGPLRPGQSCRRKSNYRSLLWARIIQGVGLAPFEALVNASVGDLYFVHQRGLRMALTNLALFGGAFFTPVVVGKMTHTIGWEWSFYFIAIFMAPLFIIAVFFLPETAYQRDEALNTDTATTNVRRSGSIVSGHELETRKAMENGVASKGSQDTDEQNLHDGTSTPSKEVQTKTGYWRTLAIVNGRKSNEGFLNLLFRPLPLFFHPGILWVSITSFVFYLVLYTVHILISTIGLPYPRYPHRLDSDDRYCPSSHHARSTAFLR